MALSDQWAMVRVRRVTLDRLHDARESMLRAMEQGSRVLSMDNPAGWVGLDTVINVLLDTRVLHAQRRKAAQCRRAERRRAAQQSEGADGGKEDRRGEAR